MKLKNSKKQELTVKVSSCFLLFDNNSVWNLSYNNLVLYTAVKALIDGTEFINCGDKYAGEFTFLEIKTFDKQPIKLHLV